MKRILYFLKKKNLFFYLVLFFLFLYNFAILKSFAGDNYFNYGFAYNIVNGLIPYRDFNMVLFPFAPFLNALILKLFGSKMIIYFLFNSLIYVLIVYLADKLSKGVNTLIIFMLFICGIGGYNALSILLVLLLIYLEKEKKSDYLIGIITGISIMTNQKLILLLLPVFYKKNLESIFKRLIGIIVPFQMLSIYLYNTNSLTYFIDYTILGLFDFGNDNLNFTIWIIVILIVLLSILYRFYKTKNKLWLYCLVFSLLAFPIFDQYHVVSASIPFVVLIYSNKYKIYDYIKCLCNIFVITSVILITIVIIDDETYFLNRDINNNCYLTISSREFDTSFDKLFNYYNNNIDKYDNIYFLYVDSYYFKIKKNIKINKFDLVSLGNNGYDGNNKLKREIKKLHNSLFIVYNRRRENDPLDQTNYELISFVENNYQKIDHLDKYLDVYLVDN